METMYYFLKSGQKVPVPSFPFIFFQVATRVYSFYLFLLCNSKLFQTRTGPHGSIQEYLLVAIIFFWETLLFPRNLRNNLMFLASLRRRGIMLWLQLFMNYNGLQTLFFNFISFLFNHLYYTMTTLLPVISQATPHFMNAPSIYT